MILQVFEKQSDLEYAIRNDIVAELFKGDAFTAKHFKVQVRDDRPDSDSQGHTYNYMREEAALHWKAKITLTNPSSNHLVGEYRHHPERAGTLILNSNHDPVLVDTITQVMREMQPSIRITRKPLSIGTPGYVAKPFTRWEEEVTEQTHWCESCDDHHDLPLDLVHAGEDYCEYCDRYGHDESNCECECEDDDNYEGETP